jgi:hypothetical protein
MIQSGLVILAFAAAFAYIAKKTASVLKKEESCQSCAFKEKSHPASKKTTDKA